ncbi:dynein regulatory complex protein 1 isoform X2 [Chelonus insularis]|nr:dynein regulatory complex protein 1 isoform X2 [Chelonus insularis]
MQKLVAEGDEVISNVRIANDAREIHRREEDFKIREVLLNKLKEEAEESMMKCKEINSKWPELLESKDPLDIHNGIESQKIKCQEVLEQKDVIINELKKAIDNADHKFAEDQKKQNEDIDLLIDRIDTQINLIYKGYRRELNLIEDTLKNERNIILEDITKRWDSLYEERQNNELQGVERRREIMREYEKEMNRVLIEHQEQYRAQKIWLESECQKLQQEVENMKAVCLLNLEKLEYSYAILKRRESENIIVKNQQKRRINKLQDIVNNLKKNYTDLEISTKAKIEKLMDEINKAKKNIIDLELKSNHFTMINDKQFMQIWEMNTKNADKLLEQIFKVDKIVYEQMLGLEWEPPKETLLKKEQLPSYCKAMLSIERDNAEKDGNVKLCKSQIKDKSPERINSERKLLRHIMMQISDQAEFLVEEKILELLSQYSEENRMIVKLDHVFQALNITSEDQIHVLINFFLPYSYCPTCIGENEKKINELLRKPQKEKEFEDETICPCNSPELDEKTTRLRQEVLKYISTEPKTDRSEEENIEESKDLSVESITEDIGSSEKNDFQENNLTCDKGHLLEIQSENVIKALLEFKEKYSEATRGEISQNVKEKISDNKVVLSRCISEEDMREYWRRYRDIFSSKKEKLWDALMIGLKKYHEILRERQKLINETEAIQKQNSELRRLLESYGVKSTANSTQRKSRSAHSAI